jgi:hypothetical protein
MMSLGALKGRGFNRTISSNKNDGALAPEGILEILTNPFNLST